MKKWIFPLVLLLVLAGLIVGTVLMKRANEDDIPETEPEETYIYLISHEPSEVVGIEYACDGGSRQKFVLTDGKWCLEGDEKLPLDQDILTSLANALSTVAVDREVVGSTDSPENYGLKEENTFVTLSFKDGSPVTFVLGNEEKFSGDLYLRCSLSSAVYLVSANMKDFLTNTAEDLLVLDTIPKIDPDTVTKLTVTTGGEVSFLLEKTGEREYTRNGEPTSIGPDFIELITDFSVDHLAFYDTLTDEVLTSYGLDEAHRSVLEMTYEETVEISAGEGSSAATKTVTHQFRMFIGEKREEIGGLSYCFYQLENSDFIYRAPVDAFGEML